jgi:hypothetical protein
MIRADKEPSSVGQGIALASTPSLVRAGRDHKPQRERVAGQHHAKDQTLDRALSIDAEHRGGGFEKADVCRRLPLLANAVRGPPGPISCTSAGGIRD